MTTEKKIIAYRQLLDEIKASMNRVDGQITTLVGEYENLKALYDAVSGDIQAMAASIEGGVRS